MFVEFSQICKQLHLILQKCKLGKIWLDTPKNQMLQVSKKGRKDKSEKNVRTVLVDVADSGRQGPQAQFPGNSPVDRFSDQPYIPCGFVSFNKP